MDWSDVDGFTTNHKFMRDVPTRQQFLATADISGPQFLSEAPSTRRVDPLEPNYVYDGGPYGEVDTKSKKYGSMFPRKDEEAFGLMTQDISAGFSSSNPKATYLLSTRTINRTDDITGAQADTKGAGPQIWRKPGKDPATCYEKETNRTWDIDGAVAGTGGQSIRLYRAARQAEAIERGKAARVASRRRSARQTPMAASSPERAPPPPRPSPRRRRRPPPRSARPPPRRLAPSRRRRAPPPPPPPRRRRADSASRQADIDAVSALPWRPETSADTKQRVFAVSSLSPGRLPVVPPPRGARTAAGVAALAVGHGRIRSPSSSNFVGSRRALDPGDGA